MNSNPGIQNESVAFKAALWKGNCCTLPRDHDEGQEEMLPVRDTRTATVSTLRKTSEDINNSGFRAGLEQSINRLWAKHDTKG